MKQKISFLPYARFTPIRSIVISIYLLSLSCSGVIDINILGRGCANRQIVLITVSHSDFVSY